MCRAVSLRVLSLSVVAMLLAATAPAQQSTSPMGNGLNARARPGNTGFDAVIDTSNVVLRSYRLGLDGPSYPVALKGRAWISLETSEIIRMETDLVAPLPQIRLALDHIAVEYGPVHFRQGAVDMWLPQSAEIFYEWRGHRAHRLHTFSNYMLFSVDDKQRISAPKGQEEPPSESGSPAESKVRA
jgi:hypothetical protein